MGAITSIEQLGAYRDKIAAGVKADLPTVLVCFGTGCQANGARPVAEAFTEHHQGAGARAGREHRLSRPRAATATAKTGRWWRSSRRASSTSR